MRLDRRRRPSAQAVDRLAHAPRTPLGHARHRPDGWLAGWSLGSFNVTGHVSCAVTLTAGGWTDAMALVHAMALGPLYWPSLAGSCNGAVPSPSPSPSKVCRRTDDADICVTN